MNIIYYLNIPVEQVETEFSFNDVLLEDLEKEIKDIDLTKSSGFDN